MKINPYDAPEIPDMIIRLQGLAKYKLISKNKILKDIRNCAISSIWRSLAMNSKKICGEIFLLQASSHTGHGGIDVPHTS